MFFSKAEIEVLRLTGWLKLLPLENNFSFSMLSPANLQSLLTHKLLYVSQNQKYLCLTPTGWDFIHTLGYDYPCDSGYISKPDLLLRREQCAKMALLFYRAGFDIFRDDTNALQRSYTYLTSTASRRDIRRVGSKLWQGVRMTGVASYPQQSYMAHYADDRGLLFASELSLFHKLIHNEGRCIVAADSYLEAAKQLTNKETFPETKSLRGWATFDEAHQRMELPLHLLECSDMGAIQLQVMSIQNYRKKIMEIALGTQFCPPPETLCHVADAFWAEENMPLVMLFDMDVRRVIEARRQAVLQGYRDIGIVSFKEQMPAIAQMLGNAEAVTGFVLSAEYLTSSCGLKLFEPAQEPYQTADGRYISLADIPQRKRAGRPAGAKEPVNCMEEKRHD